MVIEADDALEAAEKIEARGLLPISELGGSDTSGDGRWLRKRFDVTAFAEELTPLLKAGIPLEKALQILLESTEAPSQKRVLEELRQGLHEGRRFSSMLEAREKDFPRIFARVICAGEEAGALPEVMAEMLRYFKLRRETRRFIVSSLVYPAFVLVVCGVVLGVLLGIVVPRFASVIVRTGVEPGTGTKVLMAASRFVHDWWILIPFVLAAGYFLLRQLARTASFRNALAGLLVKLPGLRRLVTLAEMARLSRTMAVLLKNAVPMLDSVRIATGVVHNDRVRESIAGVVSDLRKGERLSVALGRSEYVPMILTRMLAVGEETGQPEDMLSSVAERFDDEFRVLVKRLLAWFEPAVIVVLGGIVGGVVLTLFLAILDMQQGF